jgi:hypothetical protein
VRVFHDIIVVAPLKHLIHIPNRISQHRVFHDIIVVAPLKLVLGRATSSHANGSSRKALKFIAK